MKNLILILLSIACLCISCTNSKSKSEENKQEFKYMQGITVFHADKYTEVKVKNPWIEGEILHTYILVHRDSCLPENLPNGTLVRVPLKNVLVYSGVHAEVIDELGHISSVQAVCDAPFFKNPKIVDGLKNGSVIDCGSTMAPVAEKIISKSPEAIILSPFQNAGYGILENIGTPIIEMADYMETTPLGRAEWIKFIGMLFCSEEKADSIFDSVATEYETLKSFVANKAESRPKVISEYVMSGVWYVPGGKSYKAILYKDAGAMYPWSDDNSNGSLALDFPQVFNKANDADFWLVSTIGTDFTKKTFLNSYSHNNQFEAFKEGNIYSANTATSRLFEETPFHPNLLLKEYMKIFHPELLPDYNLKYYKKIE